MIDQEIFVRTGKRSVYLLAVLLIACHSSSKEEKKTDSTNTMVLAPDTVAAVDSMAVYPKIKDSIPSIREVYVIARSGAMAWTEKDPEAHCFYFGEKISVVSENDSVLGVKWYNHRGFVSVVSIKKKEAGTEREIPLDNLDLNSVRDVYSLSEESRQQFVCGANERDEYSSKDYSDVEITLISKEKFERIQKTAVFYFTPDSSIQKTNGRFALPTGKGPKVYTDEGETSFQYMGQIEFLNAYVVYEVCGQCEESFYWLIDKKTGESMLEKNEGFTDLPVFSADKKYILTLLSTYEYSLVTKLRVYKYSEGKDSITLFAYKDFGNWTPFGKGFWGNDNCYYTGVVPSVLASDYDQYFDSNRYIKKAYNFRYIKIKIKGPTPQEVSEH